MANSKEEKIRERSIDWQKNGFLTVDLRSN